MRKGDAMPKWTPNGQRHSPADHATIRATPLEYTNILVRATNWVGDAVMCVPALRMLRERYPQARITVQAKTWVADLYRRERFADEVIAYDRSRWQMARELRKR